MYNFFIYNSGHIFYSLDYTHRSSIKYYLKLLYVSKYFVYICVNVPSECMVPEDARRTGVTMAASHRVNDEDWTWAPCECFLISEPAL